MSQSGPYTIAPIRVIQVRLLRASLWNLIYPYRSYQDINLTCHPYGFKLGSNFLATPPSTVGAAQLVQIACRPRPASTLGLLHWRLKLVHTSGISASNSKASTVVDVAWRLRRLNIWNKPTIKARAPINTESPANNASKVSRLFLDASVMVCTSVSKLGLYAIVIRETVGSVFVARGELAFEPAMVAKSTRDGTI